MVQYRRDFSPGSHYFFTVTLKNRQSSILTQHINHLGNAFRYAQNHAPFDTVAITVLPDHLHVIWKLPKDELDYSLRWRLVKTHFSRTLTALGMQFSKTKKNEYCLWQRRFWEHRIRDEQDLINHVNYIHYNPVKHQYVKNATDWKYSSIHRYIKSEIVPQTWGSAGIITGKFGE